MIQPKFKIRTLIILVSASSVGAAMSADWYKRSIRQQEALAKLESSGKFNCLLSCDGKPLSGFQLQLTKFFDRRAVCTVPVIVFLGQPNDGELELAKQLKRVERVFVHTTDETLLNTWRREFPHVDVKPLVNTPSRLRGTYALDASATMEGLRSSGKYGDKELANFETMLQTAQRFEFSEGQVTSQIGDNSTTRNFAVVESGANYLEIESELTGEGGRMLCKPVEKCRIEFTKNGFWRTLEGTGYRVAYVKQ